MDINHNPTCPYCKYEFDEEETYHGEYDAGKVHLGDGDESELTCPSDDCKKKFTVICGHVFNFTSYDENGTEI